MAFGDLIDNDRAKLNLAGQTPDNKTLDTLIAACSRAIQKYCRRNFAAQAYDELYNGTGDRRLLLREGPIQSVESVRYRPVTVLKVINNNPSSAIQQARVQVTATGLQLVAVSSGVRTFTTATLTWLLCPTLQALATAVNALGNGWSAQVVGDAGGDYGAWPSTDLYVKPSFGDGTTSQGALTACRQNAELKLHTYELAGYQFDARGWLLRAIPYTDPELLHPEDLIWPEGINNFRIQYTAGYTVIPEGVQEACARWVAMLWSAAQRDPALASQHIGDLHLEWERGVPDHEPPAQLRPLLVPYRRHTIATDQG
jgi:hypothetical protein